MACGAQVSASVVVEKMRGSWNPRPRSVSNLRVRSNIMKQARFLPVWMLLLLFFGAPPAAPQYLYEPTPVEEKNLQINTPLVMHSTQWCPYCRKARGYFERHKIAYLEYDIEASGQNLAQFQVLNGYGVPLIPVGDKHLQGFSVQALERLMK